jgi:hypothetical protein
VFDLTDEWELLTSPLSTALTTLEIMEADFTIMASVGHGPEKGLMSKYERKYLEKESSEKESAQSSWIMVVLEALER